MNLSMPRIYRFSFPAPMPARPAGASNVTATRSTKVAKISGSSVESHKLNVSVDFLFSDAAVTQTS